MEDVITGGTLIEKIFYEFFYWEVFRDDWFVRF